MSSHTSVFLHPKATVRVIEVVGAPCIMIDVEPVAGSTITLYFGNVRLENEREAALAQLGELQAAISACYRILGEKSTPEPGPDDPTDEPTDEPVDPNAGSDAWDLREHVRDSYRQAELDTQGEPMGGWEPRS